MRYWALLIGALAVGPAWAEAPTRNLGNAKKQSDGRGEIDARADAQLRKMSSYIAGLKSFRVDLETADQLVTDKGEKIDQLRESMLLVERPNHIRVDRSGPSGEVVFRYDGNRISLDAVDKAVYAVEPAPATIEAALDDASERLKIDAPAGDLLRRDSYDVLVDGLIKGTYIGREPIGDRMAHHIAGTRKDVDYELWIADGSEPVPLRYVITSKHLPGKPQFTVELSNWQANISVPPDSFAFKPKPGARQIAFAPHGRARPHL